MYSQSIEPPGQEDRMQDPEGKKTKSGDRMNRISKDEQD
jgi:hypothetical protein